MTTFHTYQPEPGHVIISRDDFDYPVRRIHIYALGAGRKRVWRIGTLSYDGELKERSRHRTLAEAKAKAREALEAGDA